MARALALALECPALGVGTLEIVAAAAAGRPSPPNLPIQVCHRCAPRRGLRAALFAHDLDPLAPPALVRGATDVAAFRLDRWSLAGDAAVRGARIVAVPTRAWLRRHRDARYLARLVAAPRWRQELPADPATALRPVYLRHPTRGLSAGSIAGGGAPLTWRPNASRRPVSIRTVGPFDLGRLSRLHKGCFEEAWSRSDLAHLLAMPGGFGLIARLFEGGLAGLDAMRGRRLRACAGWCATRASCCRSASAPAYRRRGVAGYLLRASMERARAIGARQMFLEVAVDNVARSNSISSTASSGSARGRTTISARTATGRPPTPCAATSSWRRRLDAGPARRS